MKKYEITDIAHPDNPNLHRIRAVTDLTEDVCRDARRLCGKPR